MIGGMTMHKMIRLIFGLTLIGATYTFTKTARSYTKLVKCTQDLEVNKVHYAAIVTAKMAKLRER